MKDHIPANWPAPKNVKAFTTLRYVWGDDKEQAKSQESTRTLIESYQLPARPTWLKQIHGNIAIPANPEKFEQEADACYTDKPNTVCMVVTADCLPVLLCDKTGRHVAAIHAGWRGLASGIIANTLAAMDVDNKQVLAWLGPAISQKNYQVGAELFQTFTENDPDTASAFKRAKEDKWLLDLYHIAKIQLKKLGVEAIYGGQYCTFDESDKFFSYRREKEKRGCLASVIWMY